MRQSLSLIGFVLCLVLCLGGCNQCDVVQQADPGSHAKYLAIAQAEFPTYPLQSEKQGNGELAIWGGRFQVDLQFSNAKGKTLLNAPIELEFPPVKDRYRGPKLNRVPFSGQYPAELGNSILGMKVGGEKQVSITSWTPIISGQNQGLLISMNSKNPKQLHDREWKNASLKIKLLKVCQPRYCLRTTYSIPSMRNRRLVQKACS